MLGNYRPFVLDVQPEQEPLCSLRIVDSLPKVESSPVYDAVEAGYPRICISHFEGGWHIEFAPESRAPFCARIVASENLSISQMEIYDSLPSNLRFSVDNALMLMFAMRSASEGTLEIHSPVTLYKGKGYAFLGKSVTGKSTHSRLWRENIEGCRLLNDDNSVVRIEGGPSYDIRLSMERKETMLHK